MTAIKNEGGIKKEKKYIKEKEKTSIKIVNLSFLLSFFLFAYYLEFQI